MSDDSRFLFTTCQLGAEAVLKEEFARRWPWLRPAFARPGFVTFKVSPEAEFSEESLTVALTEPVFARSWGVSLGRVQGESLEERVAGLWKLVGGRSVDGLHVWHRDAAAPGDHGYEPGVLPEDLEIAKAVRQSRSDLKLPGNVHPGHAVLDCVVVEPDLWWIGHHRAGRPATCWPGGFYRATAPEEAVSRAWLKMSEGLDWSQLPLVQGQTCAEIGASPGGACQALLERGMQVIGIDPADIDPRVMEHPGFTHIRRRGNEVRLRDLRKVRWLMADMNVAPRYTLDTVERIVTHEESGVRGLLLTLKLLQWDMAQQMPEYLFRVRSWGFTEVHARQLHHNRQEFCIAALRKRPS